MLLVGCHTEGPRAVVYSRGSVRLESLMAYHPAWADVRRLEALMASRSRPAPSALERVHFTEAPLPPPLPVDNALPANPVASDRIAQTAERRMDRLRSTLKTRDERVLRREQAAGKQEVEALLARILPGRMIGADGLELVLPLTLLEVVLRNEAAALLGPPREEAQARLDAYLQARRKAQEEARRRLDAERKRIVQETTERRAEIIEQEQKRLRQKSAEMEADTNRVLARNETLVWLTMTALGPLAMPSVPQTTAIRETRLSAPGQTAAGAPPMPPPASDTAETQAALTEQRARLVAFITQDIRARLRHIAAQNRWSLSFRPVPGVPDRTEQAGRYLRGDFGP